MLQTGATCGTAQLIAAVGTVSVSVTHPGVDDAGSGATVETVGSTSGGARGHVVRSITTYKVGGSSLMTGEGYDVWQFKYKPESETGLCKVYTYEEFAWCIWCIHKHS